MERLTIILMFGLALSFGQIAPVTSSVLSGGEYFTTQRFLNKITTTTTKNKKELNKPNNKRNMMKN